MDVYHETDKDYDERRMMDSLATARTMGRMKEVSNLMDASPKIKGELLDTTKKSALDSPHPLQKVFDDVIAQVANGKGEERHGNGKDFMKQPWYSLAETHGIGFLTGQAGKKLDEAQGMLDERWKREMLGAIAYMTMAVIYNDMDGGKKF